MANIKSNDKRRKQDDVRNLKNKSTKSAIKTAIKKAKDSNNELDKNNAVKLIDKAVTSGVIHKNKASRLVSKVQSIK